MRCRPRIVVDGSWLEFLASSFRGRLLCLHFHAERRERYEFNDDCCLLAISPRWLFDQRQ